MVYFRTEGLTKMLEAFGDIWELADEGCDALVITTNGYVKKSDGLAVMGRGIANQAAKRFPKLPAELGWCLRQYGNHCFVFSGHSPHYDIVTFPVKPTFGPKGEPGWMVKAELPLIAQSAKELVGIAKRYDWIDILVPRPGCGYGMLHWGNVKPVLSRILDDRFTAITYGST